MHAEKPKMQTVTLHVHEEHFLFIQNSGDSLTVNGTQYINKHDMPQCPSVSHNMKVSENSLLKA